MIVPLLLALITQNPSKTEAPIAKGKSYTQSITEPNGTIEMKTRVQRLVSPGKPEIWLVGAVHIGSKQYYAQIQSVLDAEDVVLYEGVKPAGQNAIPMKPDPKAPRTIYKILSDAIGLDFQLSDIDYSRTGWKNVDVSWETIMALNKAQSNGKPTQVDMISKLFDPNSKTVQLFTTMIQSSTPGTREAFKYLMVKMVASGAGPGLDPTTNEIVVLERNKVVVHALQKLIEGPNPPKSVAVFYGALHLPGIETTLAERFGYKEAERQWLTSAMADPTKIDATGKKLIAAFDTASKSSHPVPAITHS